VTEVSPPYTRFAILKFEVLKIERGRRALFPLIAVVAADAAGLCAVLAKERFGLSIVATMAIPAAALILWATLLLRRGSFPSSDTRLRLSRSLLPVQHTTLVVAGLTLCAGAEVAISAAIPIYLKDQFAVHASTGGLLGAVLFLAALAAGRAIAGVLRSRMRSQTFLIAACLISILGLLGIFVSKEAVARAGLLCIGAGLGSIFGVLSSAVPAAVQGRLRAGLGCGAALVPLAMGLAADRLGSIEAAFLVPFAAVVCITWLVAAGPGWSARRTARSGGPPANRTSMSWQ
jgi:nitrate/nitrite transporter NarK